MKYRKRSLPVVPPSETGEAVPPVEREGAEGASAHSVEDGEPGTGSHDPPAHNNSLVKKEWIPRTYTTLDVVDASIP
jgi:hypothetical protein